MPWSAAQYMSSSRTSFYNLRKQLSHHYSFKCYIFTFTRHNRYSGHNSTKPNGWAHIIFTCSKRSCSFCHFSCRLRSSSGSQDQRVVDVVMEGTGSYTHRKLFELLEPIKYPRYPLQYLGMITLSFFFCTQSIKHNYALNNIIYSLLINQIICVCKQQWLD